MVFLPRRVTRRGFCLRLRALDDFHTGLKGAIRDLPSNDYVEGKHFLDSLSEWVREQTAPGATQ